MLVQDILKTKGPEIHSIAPDRSVSEAAKQLTECRIGSVVVLKGSTLVGILSERDIVRAIARRGAECLEEQVSALMTQSVVTCSRDQSISNVMEMMSNGRFRHVPVVDAGAVVGVISIGDVVKHRLDETQEEVRQLAAYVAGT
ncbi:MAG: CBS domain-containing protein [Alphaproteobacteria bacterium]|nr:CBS domain-containing protein [Alphaproteobacteria bacterium]